MGNIGTYRLNGGGIMGITYREIPDKKTPLEEKAKSIAPENPLFTEPQKLSEFSFRKEGYFQIDRASLMPNTSVLFNVFRQKGTGFEPLFTEFTGAPVIIDAGVLSKLTCDSACEIVIEKSAIPHYRAYLNSMAGLPSSSAQAALLKKVLAMKENSKLLMKELLDDPRSGEKIKEVKNMVSNMSDMLLENRDMVHTMLTLSKYDYYTYTHCVNVAVMSIGLGIAAGLPEEEVRLLGVGAMLHDIGKTAISPDILNKQGKLDEYEYKRIQEHVKEGGEILKESPEVNEASYPAILQHHEKLSGSGYPNGLKGDEIALFGRVCAIADCYDALTTERPYKKAFKPYEALQIVAQDKTDYDANLLAQFIKMLGKVR
jgi:putative nucleotidyltransferase with HDIG domain